MIKIDFLRTRHILGLLIAGALSFGVVGCGGSGSGAGGGVTNNAYTGTYSGEFVDQNDVIASCTMTVSSAGGVTGQFNYTSAVTFAGSVNASGVGSVTYGGSTLPLTFGSSGLPTLGAGIGTSTSGAFLTMISNPNGLFSGFSGDYAGSVHNTTLGKTGIIALSISSAGVISGVDLFDVNGTPTLKGVTGTITSGGTLSYTVDGVTVTGNVSLSGTTISGPLQESNGNSATISVTQVPA